MVQQSKHQKVRNAIMAQVVYISKRVCMHERIVSMLTDIGLHTGELATVVFVAHSLPDDHLLAVWCSSYPVSPTDEVLAQIFGDDPGKEEVRRALQRIYEYRVNGLGYSITFEKTTY